MVDRNLEKENLNDSLTLAQLEKVNIEIDRLRGRSKWEDRITLFTPLISVLIAVGGFLFGIYQFQKQHQIQQEQILGEQQKDRANREKEQDLRIQSQIRSDVEQVVQFPNDKEQTISKVLFLLSDLKTYLAVEENSVQSEFKVDKKKRLITSSFIRAVTDDCDFAQRRDVNFARVLFDNWDDYREYLKEHPGTLEYVLSKYIDALIDLYLKDPLLIQNVKYDKDKNLYDFGNGYGKFSTSDITHFQEIIVSYSDHITLLKDGETKNWHIKKFQGATCNPLLTEEWFKIKFDPNGDPILIHCRQ